MSQVWDDPDITNQSDLLVMLALADRSNDEGFSYPGIEYIAKKSRHTDRGVQKVLGRLMTAGKLKIKRGGDGPRSTNTYQIVIKKMGEPCSGVRVNASANKGERRGKKGEYGDPPRSPDPLGYVIRDPLKKSGDFLDSAEKVIRSKELERCVSEITSIRNSCSGTQELREPDKWRLDKLIIRRNELKSQLGVEV